jgi:hypothetical protein
MLHRNVANGLSMAGILLLGLAGASLFKSEGAPAVTIDAWDREVAVDAPGREVPVIFTIHNPSHRTKRVVGLTQC